MVPFSRDELIVSIAVLYPPSTFEILLATFQRPVPCQVKILASIASLLSTVSHIMPHTRAARFRALKEAAESRDMLQMQNSTSNMGWNDYLDWETYHPDSLAWFPNKGVASDQPQFFTNTQSPTANAANGLPEPRSEKALDSNFCGLQPWYSTEMQEFSSVSCAATTRPQLSASEVNSYESTSLDEESQPTDQSYGSQPWSPNISRQLSSMSDGAFARIPSHGPTVDLTQELDDAPRHSSEDEDARRNTARVDASKKRKLAHSVIEKNYRSRIKDGMAELRHCVSLTARGRSSLDSMRLESQQGADDAAPNHSFGKFATLSNAVQYVKSLELENEALHERLDVMLRRNNTLQKIALSKGRHERPRDVDENGGDR
jgi:hypothetical protein